LRASIQERLSVLSLPIGSFLLTPTVHSADCRARTGIPGKSLRRQRSSPHSSFVARGERPALTDCSARVGVAGGAVETYPAGLAVVYLDKLSLPASALPISPWTMRRYRLHRKRI